MGNGTLSRALRSQGMALAIQIQIGSRFTSTPLLCQYGTLQRDVSTQIVSVTVLARLISSGMTDYSPVDWDLIPYTIRNFSHSHRHRTACSHILIFNA
jgi:hypothetical protein